MRLTRIDSKPMLVKGRVVAVKGDVVSLELEYGAGRRRLMIVQGEHDFKINDKFLFWSDL